MSSYSYFNEISCMSKDLSATLGYFLNMHAGITVKTAGIGTYQPSHILERLFRRTMW